MDINDFVSAFSSFTSLPNVFSRQLLLTYAAIHIDKLTCSHKDFWYFHDLYKHKSQDDEMLFPTSSAFELYKWKDQLELFTQYLSKFIIPIYEWCFIGMLFDSIEIEQEKHKQKTLDPDPYTENLIIAKSILETYMEKNQAALIHPFSNYSQIKNPSLKYAIDILSPIETPCGEYELETFFPEKFSSLPINFTNELYKAFFQSPKIFDLNLTTNLNPSYFSNIIDSNRLRGHEKANLLYIDLLKTSFTSLQVF